MPIATVSRGIWKWIKKKVLGLTELQDQPHTIARGVALGAFFGFIPLFGFKNLLAMGSARLFRGNVIAAVIAVNLHDVILPLAPVMLRWEYQLGFWILSNPHHLPARLSKNLSASLTFNWATLFSVGMPLMLGSVIVAIPFTAASYFLTLWMIERHRKRKAEKEHLVLIPGQMPVDGKKPVIPAVSGDPRKTQSIDPS